MDINEIFTVIIVGCVILFSTIYSLWYLFKYNQFKDLIINLKNIFKDLYGYTLSYLTPIFLFVFYSEFLIKKLFLPNFSIRQTMERNPQNWIELVIFSIYILTFIYLIIKWVNKIFKVGAEKILKINYDSLIVTYTIRICIIIFFLIFYTVILLPLFLYGMLGNFGNPNI